MKTLKAILRASGMHPGKLLRNLRLLPGYFSDKRRFLGMEGADTLPQGENWPILDEKDEASGNLGGYFLQDLTVASWIHEVNPVRHLDVGSRIDGFVGNLAVFREVEVLDIRPSLAEVRNIRFLQLDITRPIPTELRSCTDSLSCLHTLEHFGLGRYGDTIDPLGHLSGLEQLKSILSPGGTLYLSVPAGRERLEFNAHRIFSPETVLSWFGEDWEILRSATISDGARLSVSGKPGAREHLLGAASFDQGIAIIAIRKPATT